MSSKLLAAAYVELQQEYEHRLVILQDQHDKEMDKAFKDSECRLKMVCLMFVGVIGFLAFKVFVK